MSMATAKTTDNTKQVINGISVTMRHVGAGPNWFMRFTDPRSHKQQRIATGCDDLSYAWAFAHTYFANYTPGQSTKTVTVADLMKLLLDRYKSDNLREAIEATQRWNIRLRDKFGSFRASELTPDDIADYKKWATGEELDGDASPQLRSWKPIARVVAKTTCNRDLQMLSSAYTTGIEAGKIRLADRPFIRKFAEDNVRLGFIEQAEYDQLDDLASAMGAEGLYLRGLLSVGYELGNRREEARSLKVSQCDFTGEGTICLQPGTTKNGEGRWASMTPEMYDILWQCSQGKTDDDALFTYPDGQPVADFTKAWRNLCMAADLGKCYCRDCEQETLSASWCDVCQSTNIGYEGLLFHDLRRSAVRNMRRRGVQQEVAMKISGHKTASTFSRYNIVDMQDQLSVAEKVQAGKERERLQAAELKAKQLARQSDPEFRQKVGKLALVPKVSVG